MSSSVKSAAAQPSLKQSLAQRPRRLNRWLSWLVCGLSAVLVISLVGWSDSFSWGQAELHDSGVWVTNGGQSQYGRVNKAAGAIDTVLRLPDDPGPSGARIDVLQDGNTVAMRDLTGGRLLPIDAFDGVNLIDGQVALPPTTVLDMNGGALAAVDTRSGEVRLVGYGADQTLDLTALDQASPPLTTLPLSGPGDARVDLAVGLNGVT
ncbi:MAG: hypothetical protein LBL55_10785, partial [Propionibacteriaceae bacterium]|nr:hypothetical protein [Propionibacteriaceae bacterium]